MSNGVHANEGNRAMASIHKRQSKAGTKYVVRYRHEGTHAQQTFSSHREAQAFRAQVEDQTNRGNALDPSHRRLTYRAWHEQWMKQRPDIRDSTRLRCEGIARTAILPTFANRPIQKITQPEVQAWVSSQTDVSARTIEARYTEFKQSMTAAEVAGIVTSSPCKGIRLPKKSKPSMVILDHDEIRALADCIDPRHRALVYVLAYTGLRVGEALALTPEDVNLAKREITVSKTLTMQSDYSLSVGDPKTANGYRTVPLPRSVADMLGDHMETYPSEHLFTGGRGARMQPNNFNNRDFTKAIAKWNQQRTEAGLPEKRPRVHDLRHTAITHWIRLNAGLPRVQAWAGHASAAFTLQQYASYFPNDDSTFMDALDQGMTSDQPST